MKSLTVIVLSLMACAANSVEPSSAMPPRPFIFGVYSGSEEIIRIAHDGKIYWRGREVTTDDQYRKALLEAIKVSCVPHGGDIAN